MENATCSVPGCEYRGQLRRGWCGKHYERWRRGTLDLPTLPPVPSAPCSVEDCATPSRLRGFCVKHYHKWKKYGDPLAGATRPSPSERFWGRVDKGGPLPTYAPFLGPCWIWTGHTGHGGYGRYVVDGKSVPVHRYSYEVTRNVKVPVHLQMDHLCRVRRCVNPDHLEPVTAKENMHRSMSIPGINARKTRCLRGHPLSGDNLYINPTNGQRSCRQCNALRAREARRKAAQRGT